MVEVEVTMFKNWLDLIGVIQDSKGDTELAKCPSCDCVGSIDFQYVGSKETRIGYIDVWCTSCDHGIHMSRVKVPDGFEMLPFGCDDATLAARIPNFTRVEPVSLVDK